MDASLRPTLALPPHPPPLTATTFAAGTVVIAAVIGIYGSLLGSPFIRWDDRDQFTSNPDFNPPRLATFVRYFRGPFRGSLYPVSYAYYGAVAAAAWREQADERGDRLDPRPFHAAAIALHAAAALVVLAILRRLIGRDWPAAAGAMLFAVHPAQVEPVAWVSGQNTVVAGLFCLLSLWLYLKHATALTPSARARGIVLYSVASLFLVLALLAKPSSVVVPLVAAILDAGCLRRPLRRVAIPIGVWLLLTIPILVLTRRLQTAELVTPTPAWARPVVAADAVAFSLVHLVAPVHLLIDYGRNPDWLLHSPQRLYTWLAPAAVLVACVLTWRRWRTLSVAFAVFVAGMLPTLGFVPFNTQAMSTVTDRYLYLSMLGPALLLATAVAAAPASRRCVGPVVSLAVLLPMCVRSIVRTGDWQDERALFTRELELNPDSLPAHEVLAADAVERNDLEAAIGYYADALRFKRDDARIYFNLANALLRAGQPAKAVPLYSRAIALDDRKSDFYYNLAVALAQTGRPGPAVNALERCLSLNPSHPLARTMYQRLTNGARPPE